MARICAVCNKHPQVVNSVSNANNRVKRWVYPNVHPMRYSLTTGPQGTVKRGNVCTKCVKAKKVTKVIKNHKKLPKVKANYKQLLKVAKSHKKLLTKTPRDTKSHQKLQKLKKL